MCNVLSEIDDDDDDDVYTKEDLTRVHAFVGLYTVDSRCTGPRWVGAIIQAPVFRPLAHPGGFTQWLHVISYKETDVASFNSSMPKLALRTPVTASRCLYCTCCDIEIQQASSGL